MEVRRGEPIKDGSSQIGNRTKVKINKNKVAPPFREAEFDILYGQGISRTGEVIDVAVELGIVKKGRCVVQLSGSEAGTGTGKRQENTGGQPRTDEGDRSPDPGTQGRTHGIDQEEKKKSKLEEAAAKAAGENTEAPEDGGEVLEAEGELNSLEDGENLEISAEDDFEEFDPA